MITILLLLTLLHVVSSLKGKSPDEAPGVVLLDSITFPKVVPSCNSHILVLFLNKQEIGLPTTDGSRDNFLEVSRDKDVDDRDLLFAQVMVNGAENAKLIQRLNITSLPQLLLYPKGSDTPIPFMEKWYINGVNTRRFVTKHTGTIYKLPSNLLDFDERALAFVKAPKEQQEVMLKEAQEKIREDLGGDDVSEKLKSRAEHYIKTMEKIIEKGHSYVEEELERLNTLLAGKISDKKRENFIARKNILYHFDFNMQLLQRSDEL